MNQHDFMIEMCGNKAAWQIVPDNISSIDLETVGNKILQAGYKIGITTRLCWTFSGPADLTLYPSGKLLVKTTDKSIAESIAHMHLSEWVSL